MDYALIREECKHLGRRLDIVAGELDMVMRQDSNAQPIPDITNELTFLSDKLEALEDYMIASVKRT